MDRSAINRRTPAALARAAAAFVVALSWVGPSFAQPAAAPTLNDINLKLIMANPDWLGRAPERPYWGDDGGAVYYHRKRLDEEAFDLVEIDLQAGTERLIDDAERGRVSVGEGRLSRDRRHKVYAREGDIYVKEVASGAVRQLTRTAEREHDPLFLLDGRVAYRRGQRLLVRDLESGLEHEPFDLRLEPDPDKEDEKKLAERDYLTAQQERLFDYVREQAERRRAERERERRRQQHDSTRPPLPHYLGDDLELLDAALSPDARWLLLRVSAKEKKEGKKSVMPRYVTASGNVESDEVRVKVGSGEPAIERLILLGADDHSQRELDLGVLPGVKDDPLAELRAAAAERRRQAAGESGDEQAASKVEEATDEEPRPRPLLLSDLTWSDDGGGVLFQAFSRDNKDRWLATIDLAGGKVVPQHRITDPAWIGWDFREVGFLRDGRSVYFLSEESGYAHLYLLDTQDGSRRQLTAGRFVVDSPELSADGRHLYYTANAEHPGIYEAYRLDVTSGASERLTALGGRNEFTLSPDGTALLVQHSTSTRPPELYLQPAQAGAAARQLTRTTSERFLALPWVEPQVVAVPSSEVAQPIYSRLYLPAAPANGVRPAVVFIHGAGYLQNAHHGWSSYFREFMFHTLLVERGYVVLDMDYRGSAGYGRDWRTAIYRQMGTPEVADLKDGVAWLVEQHGVDSRRVGVYGGSYGGFLTFMALFREPELFAVGAALRPVTDWAHYNHSYTSNILNTPELDPEAYGRSSPIEYAAGLNKPLLICAGMLDDNVFFQDSVRLVQRLIELEKENWEMAIYPIEAHGFREPASWLDEYRRILKLFETHLR